MAKRIGSLLLIVVLAACSNGPAQPAQIDPPLPQPGTLPAEAHIYPVETGWFNGEPVKYYNFGTNTPLNPEDPTRVLVKNVWQFNVGETADGAPIPLDGQDNLFDATLGDADYSDMWLPSFVTAPAGYAPNTITSSEDLLTSGFQIEKQPMFVNCPMVPSGASLAGDDRPLKRAWVRGQLISYFDFGSTSPRPGNVYMFITGFDANDQPQFVAGQHVVFDSTRSERDYSDFWIVQFVKVGNDYQPDSIRSVDAITSEIQSSSLVVNYPHKK